MIVNHLESFKELIEKVKASQEKYATFSEEQVDHVFKKASIAANSARIQLAKMVVQETGMGIVEDKVIKNHFAFEIVYNKYRDSKSCGVMN